MAFSVNYSEQSAADLDEILAYIREELHNPQAAKRFFHSVNEKTGLLRDNPYMYQLCTDERLNAEGYRSVNIGNFLMFYLIDDGKNTVSISRILYGRRDIPSLFE